MSEKQALEDAGETVKKDGDEEIDKVRRKTGYFVLPVYVPFQNYQIFLIHVGYSCYLSAKIENNVKHI